MKDAHLHNAAKARGPMPKLSLIADHWRGLASDELLATLPAFPGVEWGEPFCFRCGWMAPSRSAGEYPEGWSYERAVTYAWNAASGWLERAHLHDHLHGGSAEAENLVPLCVLCHEEQPPCETRGEGIAFVNSEAAHHHIRWLIQARTDHTGKGISKPGKEQALRHMLRASHAVAIAAHKVVREMEQ